MPENSSDAVKGMNIQTEEAGRTAHPSTAGEIHTRHILINMNLETES